MRPDMPRIRSLHPTLFAESAKQSSHRHHVYIIQEGDDGPVKVGIARNAFWRRQDLQSGNFRRLYLRGVYECAERSDAVVLEARILSNFEKLRIGGEWLNIDPASVAAFIDAAIA